MTNNNYKKIVSEVIKENAKQTIKEQLTIAEAVWDDVFSIEEAYIEV